MRDVSEKDRKALQDLITQTDPAAKPQLLNLLEEKALESGDAALWELVLDNGTTTKHWPLYFRALQSGHWALQHKASDRLIIANHEDDYRLMESRFEAQARELLAGIEATLRQGSGYHVCYPLIYFAGNQHASLSLSYAEQEKLLHKREKPQKPEGALCKGAKALLLQIQEGHFGKAVQSDLEEHFKKSLMTQAATEESFRKLGIIK